MRVLLILSLFIFVSCGVSKEVELGRDYIKECHRLKIDILNADKKLLKKEIVPAAYAKEYQKEGMFGYSICQIDPDMDVCPCYDAKEFVKKHPNEYNTKFDYLAVEKEHKQVLQKLHYITPEEKKRRLGLYNKLIKRVKRGKIIKENKYSYSIPDEDISFFYGIIVFKNVKVELYDDLFIKFLAELERLHDEQSRKERIAQKKLDNKVLEEL